MRRLPEARPLWSLTVVTGLHGSCSALILVAHHVLADGIGGLAVLARLVDGAPAAEPALFPMPPPTRAVLFADAAVSRWRSLRALHDARVAHGHGGTINDVLLTAVGGSLAVVLRHRGEAAGSFIISVPVSGRREATAAQLGNSVGGTLVAVPAAGSPMQRLAAVIESTRGDRGRRGRGASASSADAAFGTPGNGGSFGMADPDTGIGYCYASNPLGFGLVDRREIALRDALYRDVLGERSQCP